MEQIISQSFLEWSERIKDQKLSNKSAPVWCKEKNISYPAFLYWQRKIKKTGSKNKSQSKFLEIPDDQLLIEVSLKGIKLSISKDFDPRSLSYFLSLLKSE